MMETNSYPEEGFLESGGYRIHYLLWGSKGPKLVLIHSMGMDAHGFDMFSQEIQTDYQILALDILDHGDSDTPTSPVSIVEHAEIMRDCYKQLCFEPNILIGHSVGGMMGMVLAAEHPNELSGLVLVDIAPREKRRQAPTRTPPPDFFKSTDEAREYFKTRYPGFVPEAVENRIKHALVRDEKGRLKLKPIGDAIRPSLDVNLWPFAERITIPTQLILGDESIVVTNDGVNRLKYCITDCDVVTVRGATHMVPQDKPEEFKKHILAFLKRLT
jgi:pimeloyl-ACP methyl ester carboxylesterase